MEQRRVLLGKRVRAEKREYWLNDGIYGSMCCIKMDSEIVSFVPLEQRPKGTEVYESTVLRLTCDSLDVVVSEIQLPELEVGEWIVSPNMGAYTKALGSRFNGFSNQDISYSYSNEILYILDCREDLQLVI